MPPKKRTATPHAGRTKSTSGATAGRPSHGRAAVGSSPSSEAAAPWDAEAREAAATFRERQHLGTAPIADLVTLLDSVPGVDVAIEPSIGSDHHGLRASDPTRGVTILAATATKHAVRLRSTLAHEFGHHVFNDPTPTDLFRDTREERRATAFAGHLLVPLDGLTEIFGPPGTHGITEAGLSMVVARYAVSPRLAIKQLQLCGFVDEDTAEAFTHLDTETLATRHGWLNMYRQWALDAQIVRPPQRIVAAAVDSYARGDLSLAALANLSGADTEAVAEQMDAVGIHPTAPNVAPVPNIAPPDNWFADWGDVASAPYPGNAVEVSEP